MLEGAGVFGAVEVAISRFRAEVWQPAESERPGLSRLRAVMDAWLSYLQRSVFPGGCFLTAASLEFDDRPGAVRDAVTAAWRRWLWLIEQEVATAQAQGELDRDLDARQVAFQLHAYVMAGNWAEQLFADPDALAASRAAIDRLLTQSG